jgi:membrane-bound inhibitor of C-type lysozyme
MNPKYQEQRCHYLCFAESTRVKQIQGGDIRQLSKSESLTLGQGR